MYHTVWPVRPYYSVITQHGCVHMSQKDLRCLLSLALLRSAKHACHATGIPIGFRLISTVRAAVPAYVTPLVTTTRELRCCAASQTHAQQWQAAPS